MHYPPGKVGTTRQCHTVGREDTQASRIGRLLYVRVAVAAQGALLAFISMQAVAPAAQRKRAHVPSHFIAGWNECGMPHRQVPGVLDPAEVLRVLLPCICNVA